MVLQDFENYLPKYDDLPSFDVISNNLEDEKFLLETTEEKTNGKNVTQDSGGNMKKPYKTCSCGTKNQILEKRKKKGALLTTECQIEGGSNNIYINGDIPKEVRISFGKAGELKNNDFRHVLLKNRRIYCRKIDGSELLEINSVKDIEDL
ncbi:hypothetical protein JTB14_021067 [Gonioctena quinquepunctata]|nr:hypothetical protein JTB14_021067 [Gonioctena quinquepunctata]